LSPKGDKGGGGGGNRTKGKRGAQKARNAYLKMCFEKVKKRGGRSKKRANGAKGFGGGLQKNEKHGNARRDDRKMANWQCAGSRPGTLKGKGRGDGGKKKKEG